MVLRTTNFDRARTPSGVSGFVVFSQQQCKGEFSQRPQQNRIRLVWRNVFADANLAPDPVDAVMIAPTAYRS